MTPNILDFTGRVAIVTGGGTGIGAATALLLARLGADVVISSRNKQVLEAKAAEIAAETGRKCLAVPADVTNEEQVIAMVQQTMDAFGRIDVLVNNAGATVLRPLEEVDSELWHSTVALNLDSAYYCSREAGKHMIAQGKGAIVNVSSMAGVHGVNRGTPYSAAKAGLLMMTRTLAMEWGPHGIRVNCVAPGLIVSENVLPNLIASGLDLEASVNYFPLRRLGVPEDIANAVVWFASDAASYCSGETIAVCGGPAGGG